MTPEQFKLHLKPQLDKARVNDGDYLQGLTLGEAKKNLLAPMGDACAFDVDAFFESRIKIWKERVGQRLVFYIIERMRHPSGLEVVKCWEDEIDSLAPGYDFVRFSAGGAMVIVRENGNSLPVETA